ncbi:hypothetical protein UFOVP387_25 [uncultured Caudovirales phage]|uniref:Uncharacterized protein n=1 Tax=uncultured Caudovirales phage TaxID=2100421 RepID=A0A6J7X0P3_9CAUD|nr:hypothetical protein UFOVP387_25 [uncultured Caudovirales phage]
MSLNFNSKIISKPTTADITDVLDKRYVTDANLTTIGNQSGTNTGDNATNSQYSGLASSKQDTLTLTTTGTSGAATLVGATLNIPQYTGGGGGTGGLHTWVKPTTGNSTSFSINGSSLSTQAATANRLLVVPFIPATSFTCSSLYINVSSLLIGSNARILIYSDLNGLPDTKIYESSNLNTQTNGIKTATTTQTFNAGTTYWIGVHSSGTQSYSALPVASLYPILFNGTTNVSSYYITPTFGSAPTTFGTPTNNSGLVFFVGITI